MARLFTGEELSAALGKLVAQLVEKEIETDIYVVGGAAFLLRQIARRSTVDVDAKLTSSELVLEVAKDLGIQNGWAPNWFNNAARIFVPFDTDYSAWELYATSGQVNVYLAPFEDLLIMKLNAARPNRDDEDLRFLIEHFEFQTVDEISYVYETRCPGDTLSTKAIQLVTQLLNENRSINIGLE